MITWRKFCLFAQAVAVLLGTVATASAASWVMPPLPAGYEKVPYPTPSEDPVEIVWEGAKAAIHYDRSGTFQYDDDITYLQFEVSTTRTVTIFTSSWKSGGSGLGFDPMLGIWDSNGDLVKFQDDGGRTSSTLSNGVPYSYGVWDTYITLPLAPGTYILTITQYWNFPNQFLYSEDETATYNLQQGFQYDGVHNFTEPRGPQPMFNGVWSADDTGGSDGRTGDWEYHLLNIDSASTDITVPLAPTAVAGPDREVLRGVPEVLDGSASYDLNEEPLTYLWEVIDSPAGSNPVLTGATTSAPTVVVDTSGIFTLQLTVEDGSGKTGTDTISLAASPPAISAQPVGSFREEHEAYILRVQAYGRDMAYQWYRDGTPLGDDSPVLALDNLTLADTGQYWCVISNANGDTASARTPFMVYPEGTLPATDLLGSMIAMGAFALLGARLLQQRQRLEKTR